VGSFTIESVAGDTADKLIINNARFDDFDFRYDGDHMIMAYNGCEIKIEDWTDTDYKPFSRGEIKFGNTSKSYADIHNIAEQPH
jgi:hypothetical protein